jgi:hypothetical protein
MPYRDALAYLHGSSSTAGQPETSTLTTLTGVSQSGTTLTYTVATGQVIPGQTVTLAGGGYTTQNVEVVAILSGGGGTGTATVNASQTVTTTTANVNPPLIGDILCQSGSQYSNLEIDFGAPNSGQAFPWLPAFPSLTQKVYTFPAEVNGQGGVEMGVHILVTSPFNTLTSIQFNVVSGPTTAVTTPIIASLSLTLAQLQVNGAHYFISLSQSKVQEFLRWDAVLTGSDPTLGTIVSWYGPRTGGEQ